MGSTKERIARSKRASAGSLAVIVGYPQVARTCMLQAGVVLSFSGIPFVSFCFTFICVLFSFLVLSFFVSMEMSLLPFFLYHYRFLFVWEYVVRFPLPGGVFLACDHGLAF